MDAETHWELFRATGMPELWLLGRMEGRTPFGGLYGPAITDDIEVMRHGPDHQRPGPAGGQL